MIAAPPWWAADLLLPIVAGLTGAAVWEGWLVRRRARRELATTLLAAMVDAQVFLCRHYEVLVAEKRLSREFRVSTDVIDTLAGRFGELPPSTIRQLAAWLRQCKELNSIPNFDQQDLERMRQEDTLVGIQQMKLKRGETFVLFQNYLSAIVRHGDDCIRALERVGRVDVGLKEKIAETRTAIALIPAPRWT